MPKPNAEYYKFLFGSQRLLVKIRRRGCMYRIALNYRIKRSFGVVAMRYMQSPEAVDGTYKSL